MEARATSGQSAIEYYERLRLQALQGAVPTGPGLSVLISRGMAALLRLVDQLQKPKNLEEFHQPEREQPSFLGETQSQIVQLLAAMVLGRQREITHAS